MIVGMGSLKSALPELEDQMVRDYGFGNHKLKDKIWTGLIRGSILLHKLDSGYVLMQTIFLPNSDQPVVAAVVKPKDTDVRELLYVEANRRGINKISWHEPTDTGYSVIIEDII